MRITVIGGAGFVGAHLVSALLQQGYAVQVYDNQFSRRSGEELRWPGPVDFVSADITDGQHLCRELARFSPSIIFHLAALHYIPYCNQHPAETLRVNAEGTLNVMLAAREVKELKGILFASSVAVYAPTDDYHEENHPPAPSDIYGLSKSLAEQIVEHYARETRLNHLSLRFSNIYGPGETNPHVIPAVLNQLLDGVGVLRLGRTEPYRDFLYVCDLVDALLAAIPLLEQHEVHEVLNLGPGKEWSVQDAVDILCRLSGRNIRVVREEGRIRDVDRMHLRADITRARRLLSWTPAHDLLAGLTKTYELERAQRTLRMAASLGS